MKYFLLLVVTAWVMCASLAYAAGPATTQAGKYTVVLSSQPSPPVVGSNLLVITVKDGEHPLSGAGVDVHIDMASMPMPADAQATPGAAAGTYGATLNFAMAGRWTVAVRVRQMAGMTMDGDGTAHYLLDTGQGITVPGGGAMPWFTLCVVGVIGATLLAIIGYRWLPWQARGYVAGTLTLLIVLLGTIVVVTKYRDSKTSTVLESATMDMSAQAAPGTTAVATELVQAAPFQASASYTGAVAPEAEEEVYPRVTGRLLSMPWYPGDQITPGQVVAQLDASELAAKDEQARQGSASALQGVAAAQAEMSGAKAGRAKSLRAVEQAEAQLAQVQSAARGADGAVKAAQSEATEARLRATESESAVNAALAGIDQANEAVEEAQSARESAGADAAYWTAEIAREQKLYAQGAIAKEELERETAQAAAAQAKLTQMKAAQRTTEAGVTRAKEEAAQARARQASAQAAIATAESRAEQSQAERESARQKISEAQAAVQTARADVRMAEAQEGVATAKAAGAGASARQAQAALVEAGTVRGYTTLRASLGGLVTARLVAPGTLVQPGTALLKIAKIDVVRLQVNVSAADLGRVRLGQVLTARSLEAQGDAPALLHARISAIFPTRDPSARTAICVVSSPMTR